MKKTSVFLLVMVAFAVFLMVMTNILLKKEYNKMDKSDTYWTYGKILEQPFSHINIEGGNLTNIGFEKNKNPSVRVFKMWKGFENDSVKAVVRQDTLFVKFPLKENDPFEKRYMGWNTLVRIFAPELKSISGTNTHFTMYKFAQPAININLKGKSQLEIESSIHNLDTVNIFQDDSSNVVFEMSPDMKGTSNISRATVTNIKTGDVSVVEPTSSSLDSWETIFINHVNAKIKGVSLLDLGHAQIAGLRLNIADSSAIVLSGGSLKKWKDGN